MPEVDAQTYFGNFDYGHSMALDPSFLTVDHDMAVFGSILDEFVTEDTQL